MNIFNSLGSNYNLRFLKKVLAREKGSEELKSYLEKRYKGEVSLLYKGREALQLGLTSLSLPPESKVAITGFTCYAVYKAVEDAKLIPYLLDIDQGLNFSAESLEKALLKYPKIKVVIVQNTLGYPADISNIKKVCGKFKLTLIEDLAHCVGARYRNGQEAGEVGELVVFSFSQDKVVDGVSGGALLTHQPLSYTSAFKIISASRQIIDQLYPFLTFLIRKTYPFGIGKVIHTLSKQLNFLPKPMDVNLTDLYYLPDLNSKLTLAAFVELDKNLDHRKKIAKVYAGKLDQKFLIPEIIQTVNLSTNLRFPILINNREKLIDNLSSQGIYISDIWYDAPIAPEKFMKSVSYYDKCPKAEEISKTIVNLPTHQGISEKEAVKLSEIVNQFKI